MKTFRRFVSPVVCLALIASGCSKAVEIPRANIDDAKYREPGSYRIRLKDGNEYKVSRFSLSDSTVAIEELMTADERYRLERASLPFEIPLSDVESIAEMRLNKGLTYGFIIGTTAAIGLVIWLASSDWSSFY